MTGSEFQEIWRYLCQLDERVRKIEKKLAEMPEILQMTQDQKDALADIEWNWSDE